MFEGLGSRDSDAKLKALDRVQAIIEFDLSGKVLTANENFLNLLGYRLEEIAGRHHRLFVDDETAGSPEYQRFWSELAAGQPQTGRFRRIGKSGREVWIEASYNPVFDRSGRVVRYVKFATDITARLREEAERAGIIAAISRSQAMISFEPDGTILDANDNFLAAVGYSIEEIRGRHHAMFVDKEEAEGQAYREFWQSLRTGQYHSAQFRRLGKNGREIWIQASYNPIFDAAGRVYKVVKFATDVTERVGLLRNLQKIIDINFCEIDLAVDRTSSEAQRAAHSADTTERDVQTMAAASEELANSVAEIASSMAYSRGATDSAFERVNEAAELTTSLSAATQSMTGILGLIQTIAGQINLLALNATIESARAGEAGRGFAVVAQEVKNLANQAAHATDQINGEINGIQNISGNVVTALGSIRQSVETMRNQVLATVSAVEEQSAVTRDMSVNMQSAAKAVTDIVGNISSIATAVTQVSGAVTHTRDAAIVLAR